MKLEKGERRLSGEQRTKWDDVDDGEHDDDDGPGARTGLVLNKYGNIVDGEG